MKILTLNTHSWQEDDMLAKFDTLVQAIVSEKVDIICLQEVNQSHDVDGLLHSPTAFLSEWLGTYQHYSEGQVMLALDDLVADTTVETHLASTRERIAETEAITPTDDNYARLLVEALHLLGEAYYWHWTPAHTGYRVYDEGIAILSREPFRASELLVSDPEIPYRDYRRRVVLAAEFSDFVFMNGHFDWYQADGSGFVYEWDQLVSALNEKFASDHLIIAGDFNQLADIDGEGYEYIRETVPDLMDSYHLADTVRGQFTVPGQIDGWSQQPESKRIDYLWTRGFDSLKSHAVIFDGDNYPVASDHFGVIVEQ
ncbi:MAG: endonuclease/exonuclease/phosphatase family protein [Aerococcus sp.]|nr:endonuclease/exonuclease/phosphatase family protein [Aerococcus sp.]